MSTGATYSDYFTAMLQALGIKPTQQDLAALASIVQYEGQNDYNNPLNLTQVEPGSKSFNSVGVQEYTSATQGVQAAKDFFGANHNPVWNQFLSALQAGNSEAAVIAGADSAYQSWGASGPSVQSSTYTTQLLGTAMSNGKLVTTPGTVLSQIGSTGGKAVEAVLTPLEFMQKIWSFFTTTDNWIRIGFIVLGFLVLLIAVDKMTDGGISGSSSPSTGDTVDVVVDRTESAGQSTTRTVQHSTRAAGEGVKKAAQPGGAKEATNSTSKSGTRVQAKGKPRHVNKALKAAAVAG